MSQIQNNPDNQNKVEVNLELPINGYRQKIISAIQSHQVVIICGETGSGKSTQLPKYCLQAYSTNANKFRQIAHTQPRRMAAISLAKRISQELSIDINSPEIKNYYNLPQEIIRKLSTNTNEVVGYKIRFEDKVSANTLIKLMTDGILVAEIQSDPRLLKYSTIILDEAHERNINIDFLLGHIKSLFNKNNKNYRPDLRLIITSATLESQKFADFFNNAPVFNIEGRSYPVDIYYRPIIVDKRKETFLSKDDEERQLAWAEECYEEALPRAIAISIEELWFGSSEIKSYGFGDVLVFLPGETEIREVLGFLQNYFLTKHQLEVLPLFSRLTSSEQMQIFNPNTNGLRIILSTNIAETSLTVPRIKYVIDSGLARINRYSPRLKINRLEIEPIAQDSAKQRAGRCGRISAGICIRLYDKNEFNSRPAISSPEIARSSLALIILRMLEMGLGDIRAFNWIDPPSDRIIHQGIIELSQLSAINNGELTTIGKQMARMPVAHTLSRMIISAHHQNVLAPLLIIVAALSTREVREVPQNEAERAKSLHRVYIHPDSDFLTLINLWSAVEKARAESASNSAFRKWSKNNFLSWIRLKEWRELHLQLQTICKIIFRQNQNSQISAKVYSQSPSTKLDINNPLIIKAIHQSLLVGMPFNIGKKHDSENFYSSPNSLKFLIDRNWQSKKTKWVLCGEIVSIDKNRLPFARKIAKIDETLIVETLPHLIEYKNLLPYWDVHFQGGAVMIAKQISLSGLIINPRKSFSFNPVGDEEIKSAREVFIRDCLVESSINTINFNEHKFKAIVEIITSNQKAIKHLFEKEQQLRRPNMLVSDEILFEFYHKSLPTNLFSLTDLSQTIISDGNLRKLLTINIETWLTQKANWQAEKFPGVLVCNGVEFKITYIFAPNQNDDGLTINVPLVLLPLLNRHQLDYLVPGMLADKISASFKTLPKSLRFKLRGEAVVDNFVKELSSEPYPPSQPFFNRLAQYASKIIHEQINPNLFRAENIPEHLKVRVQVLGDDGHIILVSRSFEELQTLIKPEITTTVSVSINNRQQNNQDINIIRELEDWDFGELPQSQTINIGGQNINGEVVIFSQNNKIFLACMVVSERSQAEHQKGLIALAKKPLSLQINNFLKTAPKLLRLSLPQNWFTDEQTLHNTIINKALASSLLTPPIPLSAMEFSARIILTKNKFLLITQSLTRLLEDIGKSYKEIKSIIDNPKRNPSITNLRVDINKTLDELFAPNFFVINDFELISNYPRYLKTILRRIEKYPKNPERDRKNADAINKLNLQILTLQNQHRLSLRQYQQLIFFINELRVGLFAEELKTAVPISIKRIEKIITELL